MEDTNLKVSPNMNAVLVLATNPKLKAILLPALDFQNDSIAWDKLSYHQQSGGIQTALSWAYCLFCDEVAPKELNYRDPFEAFGSLDGDIQASILRAFTIRHNFYGQVNYK